MPIHTNLIIKFHCISFLLPGWSRRGFRCIWYRNSWGIPILKDLRSLLGPPISKQPKSNLFCRKYQIRKLFFFGSVLRNDFRSDSDIDVLVEFMPGQKAGFLKMAKMEIEISSILGRKADLRTPAELSRYFREDVLAGAEVQYEEG